MNPMQAAVVYGIPNCDTVKKSRAWLQDQQVAHTFHDFKKQGLTAEQVRTWTEQVPWEQLLNRRGTTWRGLPPEAQARAVDAASAAALMADHPSLVRRPVVAWADGTLTVGFDAESWARRIASGS